MARGDFASLESRLRSSETELRGEVARLTDEGQAANEQLAELQSKLKQAEIKVLIARSLFHPTQFRAHVFANSITVSAIWPF